MFNLVLCVQVCMFWYLMWDGGGGDWLGRVLYRCCVCVRVCVGGREVVNLYCYLTLQQFSLDDWKLRSVKFRN